MAKKLPMEFHEEQCLKDRATVVKWRTVHKDRDSTDPYATVRTMDDGNLTMAALRLLFPTGEADRDNFILFSTGGTHGTTASLDDVRKEVKKNGFTFDGLTFVVVHPRIVSLRYGRAYPENEEDFRFLEQLRVSSLLAMIDIGYGKYPLAM